MSPTEQSPLALVTGATSGIGFELAKQFAEHGYDLVIAAEDGGLLIAKRDLEAAGAHVEAMQADLATEDGVGRLYARIADLERPLHAVAINATHGVGGAFATDTELSDELEIVDLNIRGTVQLAKYVVRDMVSNRHGRILFASSIAATTPGAFQAVAEASKAFLQSFALALRHELTDTGVTVTTLMPGPSDPPAEVAGAGFRALMNGAERA